ncbi:MYND Zn-finger protein [Ceratobasidium sp. AG-Ba]|nr:MYND Zn-finger protein [Ceratobasidium sp. AG-Ba]
MSTKHTARIKRSADPPAPTTFDVIDTSNLTDHLGLLNILIAIRPLLKETISSQSVLYTETLLSTGEDATKSFLDRICTTIPTISAVLGLAPRAYLSGFNTHSNIHELMTPGKISQYHERVAWVDPSSGDRYSRDQNIALSFDAKSLAHILFGLYDKMFANNNALVETLSLPSLAKIKSMVAVHYHQETLVALAHWAKRRCYVNNGDWDLVASTLLGLIENDPNQVFKNAYYEDICLHLHLYRIHTVDTLKQSWRPSIEADSSSQIFWDWPDVPPVVCVVITVPHRCFQPFFEDTRAGGRA